MSAINLKIGQNYPLSDLIKNLIEIGYDRDEMLSKQGTFSVLGGTIKIHATNFFNPVRVDFFGNEIDELIVYEISSGQKVEKVQSIEIQTNILTLHDKSKIRPGDYVVHEDHGIGLFSNMGTKVIEGETYSYIFIHYLNNDVLYLPVELKDKISPYIGVGRKKPKLNKLGTQTWKRNYHKTYENILKFARELLKIYAKREVISRWPWKLEASWETSLKETFGYVETTDQIEALASVYSDLGSNRPMDRLIVGDVGFGKTEVALRAAAQACANNFQVAVVVPTTVLAEQHYITFKKRFAHLPVRIDHISRMVGLEKSKEVKKDISEGKIDIIIGTHALLNENIRFKSLGMIVIDEEQKFGVKQKEVLKKIRSDVNVLSLSATPIPRTLFMSLSGLRDISQIYSPPAGRKEIETNASAYDESMIRSYISRELGRGGQVYYLHNEVATIEGAKNKLTKMFPKARIKVAHGQMGEMALAKTMSEFVDGTIDILVCSTIIENGLDLPNANTLIVENADKFGLSQLYQIRGRIGRSPVQSYALFTYPQKELTQNAYKRLKALVDNTELGAGYTIAMSDLEIRGGGNVLGREQHGNMESVGLVLYTKMLSLAVARLKKSEKGIIE